MTISYDVDASFFKLIFYKWHGSILKLTWKVLIVYLSVYYVIYFSQKYALDESQKGPRHYITIHDIMRLQIPRL